MLSPLAAATARFGLAALVLMALLAQSPGGLPRVNLRQLVRIFLLGLTGVCLYNLFFFAALSLQSAGALAYLAFGGTVIPFVWYYQGVARIGPARSAIYTNLVPVFGMGLGALLLRENVDGSLLAGAALVLAGLVLTNLRRGA